jgi:hypothetical protein
MPMGKILGELLFSVYVVKTRNWYILMRKMNKINSV